MKTLELPDPAAGLWLETRDVLNNLGFGRRPWVTHLGGGTIIAARIRHRESTDIDIVIQQPSRLTSLTLKDENNLAKRLGGEPIQERETQIKVRLAQGVIDLNTVPNPAALLASILAGATNLGLERMARASSGVSHAQLSWASAWCLRSETYANALARIIDAHHALPVASVWGSTSRTSSDGQFFASGRRNAGEINAKYGPDPGLKIYSFLSGRYGSFHSNVIGATAGEAPFVLDGLVGNAVQFDPLVHHVDTGGVSDHVFALFHLLGLSFAPRLRDFPDRRLACFGRPGRWKELAPLMGKPINEEVVLEHWNDALRLTASIKTVSVMPSAMLRKLGAYRQQNRLYLALGEIGRIERTLFMLDWMESPQLRMECQAGLNKGEARHALARAVFAHAQGRVHDRSHEAQQKRVMALNLVIAAIVYWNTAYIEKAATHLRRERRLPDPTLLRHVSPLGWEHIVLTGDYDWNSGAAERTNARPLNLYPAKIRA